MNKYEKRTLEKKNSIINTALKLFGENGFCEVSIKDIAIVAKVSQVSIYNYFGSKEALIGECAKVIMGETIDLAEDILATNNLFQDKIREVLTLCNKQINISLSTYFSEKATSDEMFIKLMCKDINKLKKQIYLKYIDTGKKEGVIDNSISTSTIELFIDGINSIGLEISEEEMKSKQDEIIRLFLYGLIGK